MLLYLRQLLLLNVQYQIITLYPNMIQRNTSSKDIIKHNIASVAIQRAVSGVAKQFTCMNGGRLSERFVGETGRRSPRCFAFSAKVTKHVSRHTSHCLHYPHVRSRDRRRRYSKIMCDSTNKFIETRVERQNQQLH